MSKGILASALTAILLAALAAGCGGGDDSSSTGSGDQTAAALSKAEFIKQGDAICAAANKRSEEKAEEFAEQNEFSLEKATEKQLEEAVAGVLVPSLNQQAEKLSALAAPEGDEAQVEAIVASLEEAVAKIEADPTRVFDSKVLEEPIQLAAEYGFTVCGQQ